MRNALEEGFVWEIYLEPELAQLVCYGGQRCLHRHFDRLAWESDLRQALSDLHGPLCILCTYVITVEISALGQRGRTYKVPQTQGASLLEFGVISQVIDL